jgi:hypothetical protein
VHAQPPRGAAHVPAGALEHTQDVLALELLHRLAQRRARVLAQARAGLGHRHVERHVLQMDDRAPGEDDGAMQDVLELAHVAGPVVAREHLEGTGRHAAHVAVALAGDLAHEVLDECGNVLAPLAERRHVDRHDVEPIVEVLAERALAHGAPQIHVGRRQDPHIDRHGAHPAQPLDLALLQDAQELRLQVEPQGADLVEEHRAAVGELEAAELLRVRPGEGALLVAEQLRFDQRLGDRRHVDGHERLPAALAPRVDRPRHQLLAGAALAGDQHGRGRRGDLGDQLFLPAAYGGNSG